MDKLNVKYAGVDSFNRPIFMSSDRRFYGSTEKLFEYGASEDTVLDELSNEDIEGMVYFGRRFGCEPHGGAPASKLIIEITGAITNLTQHPATQEQEDEGVVNLTGDELKSLKGLLTFDTLPSSNELLGRSIKIAEIANKSGNKRALIGGGPYLMPRLERQLRKYGIIPVYSFSVRKSVEKEVDGKIIKTSVFKHTGFISMKYID